jgi:hypothetical protein
MQKMKGQTPLSKASRPNNNENSDPNRPEVSSLGQDQFPLSLDGENNNERVMPDFLKFAKKYELETSNIPSNVPLKPPNNGCGDHDDLDISLPESIAKSPIRMKLKKKNYKTKRMTQEVT